MTFCSILRKISAVYLFGRMSGLLLLIIAGCTSPPPPEYDIYTAAFQRLDEATRTAVGQIEPVERSQRPLDEDAFDPDEAVYIAEGRAENSLLIERGFRAVTAYNDLLAAYASGESGQALKAEGATFAGRIAATTAVLGAPGVGAGIGAATLALDNLADELLVASDRAAFARAVRAHSGKVEEFPLEVRSSTTDFYQAARTHALSRRTELIQARRMEKAAAVARDLQAFRPQPTGQEGKWAIRDQQGV